MAYSRSEMTIRSILNEALELFSTQGFAATTMRQIATKAGVSLGSIYNHFSSKEEIFLAIVKEKHPFLTMLPALSEVEGADLRSFVTTATKKVVEIYEEHPEYVNLFMIEVTEFKGEHAQLLLKKLIPDFEGFAKRFRSYPEVTDEFSDLLLVRTYISIVFGYVLSSMLLKNIEVKTITDHSMEALIEVILNGIQRKTESL